MRGSEFLLGSNLWALRLPSLLGSALALFFLDGWLRRLGSARADRVLACSAVGLAPWQIYTGGLLHPDSICLAALLGFAWAHATGRWPIAGLCAGFAALAKPPGLVVVVLLAALALVPWATFRRDRRRWLGVAIALGVSCPGWLLARPEIVTEVARFARVDTLASWPARIGWGSALLVGHAGIALLAAAAVTLRRTWRTRRTWRARSRFGLTELPAGRTAGIALLGLFAGAALLNGQWKENWILPSLVLLWPRRWSLPQGRAALLVAPSAILSLALVAAMHRPELVGAVEDGVSSLRTTYPLFAGEREARVSRTSSWTERTREYQPVDRLVGSLDAIPSWIVSRDYGLAAQLAYAWRAEDVRLAVLDDPLYASSARKARRGELSRGALALDLEASALPTWPGEGSWRSLAPRKHPQTGAPLTIAWRSGDLTLDVADGDGPTDVAE